MSFEGYEKEREELANKYRSRQITLKEFDAQLTHLLNKYASGVMKK